MTERAIGRIAGIWLVLAALNGGIAVATGAYASHGLTDQRMIVRPRPTRLIDSQAK